MARIDSAVLTTTRIEPSKLSLGDSASGPSVQTLTITNNSNHAVTYALSADGAIATGPNSFSVSNFNAPGTVSFDVGSSVVVAAGGSANVVATITVNPALADGSIFDGYINVVPDDGGVVEHVPYAGYKGDYQARVVLTSGGSGYPWLAKDVGGGTLSNRPAGASYTLVGNDIPYFAVHLDHQARMVRFDVYSAVGGKDWHRAYQEEYLPRNSTSTSIFAFPWDGNTTAGGKTYVVPNGTYVVKLSVLKALGDSNNPADWETWTSPPVTLARP
jgi:hypothetical protein